MDTDTCGVRFTFIKLTEVCLKLYQHVRLMKKKKKQVVIVVGKKSLIYAQKVKCSPAVRYSSSFTVILPSGYRNYNSVFIQLNSKASSNAFQTLKLIILLYLYLKYWVRKEKKAYCWVWNITLLFLPSSQDLQLMIGFWDWTEKNNVTLKITAIEMQNTGLALESVWTCVYPGLSFQLVTSITDGNWDPAISPCSRVKSSQSRLYYYFKMLKATWKALWQEMSPAGDQK